MLQLLPDELLHSIIEYLAFIPKLPDSPSKSQFKYASPELLTLSVVDRRLRRICLPFLFANIHIKHVRDAEKLRDLCSTSSPYPKLIKQLNLSTFFRRIEEGHEILRQILPHLQRLSYVDVRDFNPNLTLFRAILGHRSVSTVIIRSSGDLPNGSLELDLSKVVLERMLTRPPPSLIFEKYLDRGMTIAQLELRDPELLNEEFGLRTFNGLQEINLRMGYLPVSFSWLPSLTSTHPCLNKLWLTDDKKLYFSRHTPSFISRFVEKIHRRGLTKHFIIKRVGLSRATIQEWHVTEIMIVTTFCSSSLIEILSVLSTSFPAIETLALNLKDHKDTYHIDTLAATLSQFPSLRVLYLHHVFKRLKFGRKRKWQPVRQVDWSNVLEVLVASREAGLLWYTSRMAKRVPSLESFRIDEMGFEREESSTEDRWLLKGWLHVVDGSRKVDGNFQIFR